MQVVKMQFDLQLFGKKGGGSTTVQSYQPTAEEKRLWQISGDYSAAVAPNALWLNDLAAGLLKDSIGSTQVDYSKLNDIAQKEISNAQAGTQGLINGQLPEEYQKNMQASIQSGVQNSMGNMLADLGNRGVINSSITNKGIQGINDSAANAMSKAYQDNVGLLSQLYGQQLSQATSGITAGAAAQEAAQQPATNLWNASLGLNGATTQAISALAGTGTKTATQSNKGGSDIFGSVLGGLASGLGNAWCFTENTKIATDNGDQPISKVNVGDIVLCPIDEDSANDSKETVVEVMNPYYTDVYTLVCMDDKNNKYYVSTTLSQPLMTEDKTFITVDKMDVGKTKLFNKGTVCIVKSVISIGERLVYDLKLTGDNNYYADGFIAKGAVDEW